MKVSVIIPMYNAVDSIINTLDSVRNQSIQEDIEIIVVNDGSVDNSRGLVEDYVVRYSDFNLKLINQVNGGVSKARNVGLKSGTGKYLALLDADDVWDKEKLKVQVAILDQNENIDLLGCNRNGEVFTRFFKKKFSRLTPISARLLLYKNFFSTPTVIFRRSLLDGIGYFDESQKYAEEGNYWLRICNEKQCVLLNESYVLTGNGKPHFGHSGLSANLREMEIGELKNIKKGLELKVVGLVEYWFLIGFSILKYIRRTMLVNLRK